MARTELPNGVILPAEYSDDWYEDMTSNLTKLDDVIGSDAEKLNADGVNFLRMSSAALTDGGTGNFSDLNSSYKIKTDDLVLDSGRKLYKIVSVDSTNETFTVGNSIFKVTAESDLAPVAESGDYDDLDNKPDLKPVATSGDYDDLTELPTYGITRFCSSAISDNSSVAFSAISSTNKIKVGDFLLDTNGKLYQISAVDTANETVSVTTPLTQLAVDANVMHLSGNETASGDKNFTDDVSVKILTATGKYISDEGSTNRRTVLKLLAGARDTDGYSCSYVTRVRTNKAQGALISSDVQTLGFDFVENQVRTLNTFVIRATNWLNDVPQKIELTSNIPDYTYGNSLNKAKINDLNPGSLSFPDLNNGIDISGYITAEISHNEYTPTVDGWISVIIKKTNTTGAVALFIYQGDICNSYFGNTALPNESEFSAMASIPVRAGIVVNIDTKGSNTYVYSAKFYPNLGNV